VLLVSQGLLAILDYLVSKDRRGTLGFQACLASLGQLVILGHLANLVTLVIRGPWAPQANKVPKVQMEPALCRLKLL